MHRSFRIGRLTTAVGVAAFVAVLGFANASAAPAATSAATPGQPPAGVSSGVRPLSATNNQPTPGQDLFVPIAPCRVANTIHHGGALADNGIRTFYVRGTFGFAPQGGVSGGCGIPLSATAVVATVNALNSTLTQPNAGYLLGYPAGGAVPTANFMAFKAGGNSSNPTLTLPTTTVEPSLSIKALGGSTDLAIDVTGYYTEQMHVLAYVSGSGSQVYSGSAHVVSITGVSVGNANLTFDRDVSYCTTIATSDLAGHYAIAYTYQGSSKVDVQTWTVAADGTFAYTNGYVYLTITC